jgi:DNA-directed RNA polymerase subunit alpha
VRTANCLQNAEIHWIGQLVQKTESELLSGNFGAKSLAEIKEILSELELHLGMNVGSWTPPD